MLIMTKTGHRQHSVQVPADTDETSRVAPLARAGDGPAHETSHQAA